MNFSCISKSNVKDVDMNNSGILLKKYDHPMKKIIYSFVIALSVFCFNDNTLKAQTSITALSNTTICRGQCAALTATIGNPVNLTTSYTVGSIPYAPFAYSGGTALPLADDDWTGAINIGFNFCYFGNTFSQVSIGSNGEITFSLTPFGAGEFFQTTTVLPNLIEHRGNTICGVYKDLYNITSGTSGYYTTGVAPNRSFVVYWNDVPVYGAACTASLNKYQIVLHENTNYIDVNIEKSANCSGLNSGFIGIQDATASTVVAPPGRNTLTAWTANNESWSFIPTGTPNYTVNWSGPNGFTATGLSVAPCPTSTSNYTATMNVANCGSAGAISYSSSVQVSVTPMPTLAISSSSAAICSGNSVTLTASGAATYTWLPGNSTSTVAVFSPTSTTTYTLIGANGNCTTSAVATITVSTVPTLTVTRNPALICGIGSSTLTATGTATSFTWMPGALSGSSVVVSPTVTTIYTVTGANATGCQIIRTTTIAVSPNPTITPSASSSTICSGGTTSLSATGGTSYTWTPGPIVGFTVVVTPTVSTTYTVRGRSLAGCTSTNTINITVVPGIIVTPVASPTTICIGGTSTLIATGANTYTWNPGALTGSNVAVTPTVTTTYTVVGSDLAGCNNLQTVTVIVNTPTIVASKNPANLCSGNAATLTASAPSVVGASSYTWNPGGLVGNPVTVSPSVTTLYTVVATNTAGCVGTRTINVVVVPTPTVNLTASSNPLCSGTSATLTASGANTYTWNPGALTTTVIVVTPTASVIYTVTGRNAIGNCRSTQTLNLQVTPALTLTPLASPSLICSGAPSTLTVNGATNYTWNPGALTGSNVAVSPTLSTTYSVTGTNTLGCTASATVAVNISTISVTGTSNPTIMCSTNSATLTGSGAASYTWNPGALTGTSVVVTPTTSTTYSVVGTNTLGCSSSATLSLSVGTTPTVTASSSQNTICSGATVTLSSSGATTYTWMPGALTGSVVSTVPSSTTIYTVTGSNASGCTGTNTVSVQVNLTPTLVATSNPPAVCLGNSSTLTVSGANSYTWNPGAITTSSFVITPTVSITYSIVGTTSLNCTSTTTVDLKVNANPTVMVSASSSTVCSGLTTSLTAGGANTFTWNPGNLTGFIVAVSPTVNTTYTVVGTNINGCVGSNTIAINVISNPTITATSSPTAICSGASATLDASGGTSYTWSPSGTFSASISVSPTVTTTYSVAGQNINGCLSTQTVQLVVNSLPTLTATSNPSIVCLGNSATLTGAGASTYTWNPGNVTTATTAVTPSATTVYTLTGLNASGCVNTQTLNLVVTANPTITISSSSSTVCEGGSVTLTATGAVNYTWTPDPITGSVAIVSPTTNTIYSVVGTTTLGCSGNNTIAITVIPAPSLTATASSNTICSGSSVILSGSGAATYTWNPGNVVSPITIVSPTATTIYTLTGTSGSCSSATTVQIDVNTTPTVVATSNPTLLCSGGSATLTASGATAFLWNAGALFGSTVVVTPTVTTDYTVTGVSGICSNTTIITMSVGVTPTLSATASSTAVCAGTTLSLSATGATSYTWNPGALTGSVVTVAPIINTTYSVVGTNTTGCSATETVAITINPNPTVTAVVNPTAICVGSSATITPTANGGTPAYTFSLNTLSTTFPASVSPIVTTIYTIDVSDNKGCMATNTVQLVVNAQPTVSASSNPTLLCSGSSATLTGSGAASYTWNPGALTGTTSVVSPTINTTYTVTGATIAGCSSTSTVDVTVIANPTITASALSSTICTGNSTTLAATGATSYTWNPGAISGASVTVSPTITTTYSVVADNGLGCTTNSTVIVNVNALPSLTVTSSTLSLCGAGSVTLTASGAINYTWSPIVAATATVVDNPTVTTTYSVIGEDAIGCSSSSAITVSVNAIPNITLTASSNSICSGSTVSLTATGATSYTWNPTGAITNTITDAPLVNTTYTVTGDNAGCIGTNTIDVTVVSNPTITATAIPSVICFGSTSTLTALGAINYTWMPSSLNGSVATVTPAINTTYTVTGDDGLCSSTQTVQVNVTNLNPMATVSGTIDCNNPTVDLFGTSTSTNALYVWAGPNAYSSGLQNPTGITAAGDYTLGVMDLSSFCTATTVVTVISNTVTPTLTLTSTPALICNGGSTTLTASGATTYTWMPDNVTGTSVVLTPTTTTQYTVTGVNGICVGTETITVTVGTIPTLTLSANANTICAGSTVSLTATGALTYTWNPSGLTGTTVTDTPTLTTTYTVSADNGSGCIGTETITINVNTAPSISITASSTVLCGAGSVTLTASGANNYTWSPVAANTPTIADSPTVTTTYSVTGDNAIGCLATQTVMISVNNPSITIASSSNTLCLGSTATLTASGVSTYTWLPLSVSGATVTDAPIVTTTYTVNGDDAAGCPATNTFVLVVSPSPTIIATASATDVCANTSVTLTGSGATSYTWNPGALTGTSTVVTPTTSTTYTVDGDNGSGCIASQTIAINVNAAPSISIAPSSAVLCGAGSVTLTASGANNYTWSPVAATTPSIADSPTVTTTYSVTGDNAFGCTSTQTITINVSSNPTITIVGTPTTICVGTTATLTASGASTFTWNPTNLIASVITDAPATTTTYTVTGDNGLGCINTNTFVLNVSSGGPTMTVTANPTLVCSGSASTLTALGATTYTWLALGISNAPTTVTPTISTTYSVLADNGVCVSTTTVSVTVDAGPANVTTTVSGAITCNTLSVDLFGNSTTSGVVYGWTGPNSYTSSVQNPTGITASGDYTLGVFDPLSTCSATSAITVVSNTTVPIIGLVSPSPMLGCNATVTLSVITSVTPTLTFAWSSPASFTSSVQNPTTSVAGDYTVTVFDVVNGCQNSAVVTVGSNTVSPAFTASATPATCSGTVTNSDGAITIGGYAAFDTYDLSQAATYTGTANYATANAIPFSGILTSTLVSPLVTEAYTIRVFSNNGCFTDVTVNLNPTTCTTVATPTAVIGMTKAVGTPTFVNINAYNVTYTIVATNASTVDITSFNIMDDLSATFPLPTTYSVISSPVITSLNSSLSINSTFDGSLQNNITSSATSTLLAGKKDTIVFTVQVNPHGKFGPFKNSAIGSGVDNNSIAVMDSSNTGFLWDPDNDGDPTNNDTATVVTLTPHTALGIAKFGKASDPLEDKTVDVTYVFTLVNYGNDTLKNVQVFDTLNIPSPATFSVKTDPIASGSLVTNVNYNGSTQINLLSGSLFNVLAPGAVETITLVVNIKPDTVTTVTNSAIIVGTGSSSVALVDTSNTGYDPDPNSNGFASDVNENKPTIVKLPNVELFIPEVFTPDGDGKNDVFIIKGIAGRDVKISVFNRWGNTVYENTAYDNTWDGTPNVSDMMIGNSKLPQGTYYYVVEFADGKDDSVNGFIVLQY